MSGRDGGIADIHTDTYKHSSLMLSRDNPEHAQDLTLHLVTPRPNIDFTIIKTLV